MTDLTTASPNPCGKKTGGRQKIRCTLPAGHDPFWESDVHGGSVWDDQVWSHHDHASKTSWRSGVIDAAVAAGKRAAAMKGGVPPEVVHAIVAAAAPWLKAQQRREDAQTIINDLVCCDLYEKINAAGMAADDVIRRAKEEHSYHPICHWAGFAAALIDWHTTDESLSRQPPRTEVA